MAAESAIANTFRLISRYKLNIWDVGGQKTLRRLDMLANTPGYDIDFKFVICLRIDSSLTQNDISVECECVSFFGAPASYHPMDSSAISNVALKCVLENVARLRAAIGATTLKRPMAWCGWSTAPTGVRASVQHTFTLL